MYTYISVHDVHVDVYWNCWQHGIPVTTPHLQLPGINFRSLPICTHEDAQRCLTEAIDHPKEGVKCQFVRFFGFLRKFGRENRLGWMPCFDLCKTSQCQLLFPTEAGTCFIAHLNTNFQRWLRLATYQLGFAQLLMSTMIWQTEITFVNCIQSWTCFKHSTINNIK